MNASAIADVIRRVAENQAEQFKAALAGVRKDCEASIADANRNALALVEKRDEQIAALKSLVEAKQAEIDSLNASLGEFAAKTAVYDAFIQKHAESADQHNAAIEALKKSLDVSAEIKAIEDLLLEEREQRVADVSSVKSDVDARFKSLDDSLTERETKQAEALESVRKEFSAAVESATKEVRSEIVGIQKQVDTKATAADVEKHLKDAAVSWTAIEQKCAADIQAVREVVEDRSYVETIEKELASLKSDITKSREAAEAADAELRACVDAVSETIGKALSEAIDEQKAEIEKVAKSIEDLPAVPEIPAEIFSLPEVVKAFVAEVSERVEKAEKMASGCVKFAGAWDEEGTYEQGALVVGKNALWVALKDHPSGAIGERDSGWKMVLKSGKLITPYEHR